METPCDGNGVKISLEPKATAKAKIGVNGKWINVQDPTGTQGYVAAWYVSETKGQPAAPASAAPASTSTTSATTTPASTTPAAPAKPIPAGAMAFVPTEGSAFRSQPNIAPETLIRRIPVTEQLICLEPANFAIPKVGVVGKWLKVRDLKNMEGFVAAWYVKYASGSTAQDPTSSQPASSAASAADKVKATAQAVAFRKQPFFVVSELTLILLGFPWVRN